METINKNIIAVVGLAGSGKSVVANYLEGLGYDKIYFGGIVIEEVKRRGLAVEEKNERLVREELRKRHGMGAMAILSVERIKSLLADNKKVLIDGLYSMSEYKILKEEFPEMTTLAVFTPRKLRYDRLESRTHRPLTNEESKSRDYAEIDNIEKGGPIAIADYTIINDSSMEDLCTSLEKVLSCI